jgi:hypothetical protein
MNGCNRSRTTFGLRVRVALLACVIVALAIASPVRAAAQEQAYPDVSASPALPLGHWAVVAAKRAEALGLVRQYLPAQTAVPRHLVGHALREAAERAAESAPHLEALTQDWLMRFAQEFAADSGVFGGSGVRNLGTSGTLGYVHDRGRVHPGAGLFPDRLTGAALVPDRSALLGGVSVAAGIGSNLSLLIEPLAQPEGLQLQGWEVRAGWRNLGLSAGRQPVGYGYSASGGVVLSGSEPIDRFQFETLEPFRLPSLFRRIGLISAHAFLGRLDEPRHPGDPYIWGMAGSVQPHPRLTVSVHRASIIAGDSIATPLTPRTFFRTFIGHNLLGFENEVVAGQLRMRLPTERFLPLTLYTEWGAEDAAGAWRDVPGRLYGIYVAAMPGLPQAALGAEHVSFAHSCCGNPPWYRHHPHAGGWVMDERPLGHPLGGQGEQSTVYAQADLLGARLRLNGQLFARRREGENLYVPGREGTSTGFEAGGIMRVHRRSDAMLTIYREAGAGWTERSFALGLRAYF